MHVDRCVWKPEADVRYIPQSLYTVFILLRQALCEQASTSQGSGKVSLLVPILSQYSLPLTPLLCTPLLENLIAGLGTKCTFERCRLD